MRFFLFLLLLLLDAPFLHLETFVQKSPLNSEISLGLGLQMCVTRVMEMFAIP